MEQVLCLSLLQIFNQSRHSANRQVKRAKYDLGGVLDQHIVILFSLSRSTQKCIRTMSSGYCLSSFFVPGDRHVVVGTKVMNLFV